MGKHAASRAYRHRLSAVEVVALCIVVSAVTVMIYRERMAPHKIFSVPALAELGPLMKYGPDHFSMGFEEWVVRDYFNDRRGGVFLDVGANHYKAQNNTYYLET